MELSHLSIHGKSTPRSSMSIYITNSINLPLATLVRWRVSSFIPRPSSILAYARNQFFQAFIVRLFCEGNQIFSDSKQQMALIKNQSNGGTTLFSKRYVLPPP